MSCARARRLLSDRMDGSVDPVAARALEVHLARCARCAEAAETMTRLSRALRDLNRIEPKESIASRVFDRIEVEERRPGLAHLLQPTWSLRPLLPWTLIGTMASLALFFGLVVAAQERAVEVPMVRAAQVRIMSPAGTENNPLPPLFDVTIPRSRHPFSDPVLASMKEGTFFVETVVARDGSVSGVTLIDGDFVAAVPVMSALRAERFEPGSLDGRPVAVSLYRLIARMDVKPPVT